MSLTQDEIRDELAAQERRRWERADTDPVELVATRIECDGQAGTEAAESLRLLDRLGHRYGALQLAAYIDRLEQDLGTVGELWAQEAQG